MTTLLLTLAVFAVAMLIMAIGVIMRRPCLRGSCGGPGVLGPDGEPLTCATCPNRNKGREDAESDLIAVGDRLNKKMGERIIKAG